MTTTFPLALRHGAIPPPLLTRTRWESEHVDGAGSFASEAIVIVDPRTGLPIVPERIAIERALARRDEQALVRAVATLRTKHGNQRETLAVKLKRIGSKIAASLNARPTFWIGLGLAAAVLAVIAITNGKPHRGEPQP